MGKGSGCGHMAMIPLSSPNHCKIVIADLADALHDLLLSKVEHRVMIDAEFYQRARLETCRQSWRGRPFAACYAHLPWRAVPGKTHIERSQIERSTN